MTARAAARGACARAGDDPVWGSVAALVAVQRRHALRTLAVVGSGLALLLGAFALVPAAGAAALGGVPAGWLALTAGVQPVWLVVALRHVRAAERAERELVRAVRRRGGPLGNGPPRGRGSA
ncbi:MAG: hypothetical protein DIU60_014785 [Actinomycetes bacterium]|jgi:hypothetical protein|nr:MAG: hypothetical protein DIU60_22810 [Actinomycetota bacterium]